MSENTTALKPNTPAIFAVDTTMRALASIAHFGESMGGTEQVLRRESVFISEDEVAQIPIISGNALRGFLRDCTMQAFLEALAAEMGVSCIRLSPAAFYFLFSGGALTKDAGRGLDMGQARRLRELLAPVGIFGGAVGRQILEGKLQMAKVIPLCAETRHLLARYDPPSGAYVLPPHLAGHPHFAISIYDQVQMEHYTRMDDAKRESLAGRYLQLADQTLLEAPRTRKITNKRTGEAEEVADKPGTAQQMRYGFETFVAGTVFRFAFRLLRPTRLEVEAFARGLIWWSQAPTIGGKASIGLGEVELTLPGFVEARPQLQLADPAAAVLPVAEADRTSAYDAYLRQRGAEIVDALGGIS